MPSTLIRGYAAIVDGYVTGRLPIPGPLLQALLTVGMELHYRFSRTYPVLPPEWSGGGGPIARQSEDLMKIHYDKPAVLFENFLGPSMKYTMALYEGGARSLEEAQTAMLEDLCAKAGIRDGERVLDIACGFGSLSRHILERFPACHVVALNLSQVQCDWIRARQGEPGHPFGSDRFRIVQEDFSKVRLDQQFDRVMVIGLFEHIHNMRAALEKIAGLLRPHGRALLHFIAYNRIIRPMADPNSDVFFDRYVFPGGRFWHFGELPRYQDHLKVEQAWFLNGTNYKRTVEAWRANLWRNIARIRAHPEMEERFLRTWDLYLRFCIATFGGMGGRNVGNGQYLLSHARSAT